MSKKKRKNRPRAKNKANTPEESSQEESSLSAGEEEPSSSDSDGDGSASSEKKAKKTSSQSQDEDDSNFERHEALLDDDDEEKKDDGDGEDGEEEDIPRWKKVVREIVLLGILVLVIFSARWSLADHYHVPSGSMIPTVEVGDRIVVNKLAYSLRVPFTTWSIIDFDPPARGDIIVLDSPVEDVVLLKRVIAVPGDTVEVRSGQVWLNGEQVKIERDGDKTTEHLGDAHPIQLTNGGGPGFGPETLGDDEFLVMGDNRGNSRDGRSFGLIKTDAILGKAVRIYYRSGDGLTWLTL